MARPRRDTYRMPAAQRYHSSECSRPQQSGLFTRSRRCADSAELAERSAASQGEIAMQVARNEAVENTIKDEAVETRYCQSIEVLLLIKPRDVSCVFLESVLFACGLRSGQTGLAAS